MPHNLLCMKVSSQLQLRVLFWLRLVGAGQAALWFGGAESGRKLHPVGLAVLSSGVAWLPTFQHFVW